MQVSLNGNNIRNWLAEAGSLSAIILGAIPATGLPASVRASLIAAGGAVQAISHAFSKNSTSTTPPPTPPAAKPAAPTPPSGA